MIRAPIYSQGYPWNLIINASGHHGIDWQILASIIRVESDGNPWAYRYEPNFEYLHDLNLLQSRWRVTALSCEVMQKSSYGLTQVMGATAIDLGLLKEDEGGGMPTILFNPAINLKYCCLLLKQKIKSYGRDPLTLYASYNAGTPRKNSKGLYSNQWAVDKFNKAYKDFIGDTDVQRVTIVPIK